MSVYYAYDAEDSESLEHHGIIGMKWGVRRFQNPDGTLTPEGRERYYGSKETTKLANLIRSSDRKRDPWRLTNSVQLRSVAALVHDKHRSMIEKSHECSRIEKRFKKRADYDQWVAKAAKKYYEREKKDDAALGFKTESFEDFFKRYVSESEFTDRNELPYSFELWLKESKDPEAKRYRQLEAEVTKLDKEINSESVKAIKDFLGDDRDAGITYVNAIWKNEYTVSLAEKGSNYVNKILNVWDTFEDDFPSGSVSIEDLMRLTI